MHENKCNWNGNNDNDNNHDDNDNNDKKLMCQDMQTISRLSWI